MNFQRLNELVPKSASAATFVAIVLAAASIANAQTETVLYSFKGGVDGGNLSARLAVDGKGNLYGTTASGGPVPKNGPSPNHGGGHFGNGTVFEITPDGREKVLYNFKGGQDGSAPVSGLVRDGHGNLYGTTLYGGTSQPGTSGFGTVFQVAPDGTEKTLYSFQGGADGAYPWGDLTRDSRGHLYGITQQGGAFGGGTVFEISPDGTEKRLHEFTMGADGGSPTSGVVLDTNGNLYGTIPCINNVCIGGVFQIAPDGTYTLLYTFQGGLDGYYPWSEVVRDAAGNLYGTTQNGGNGASYGVVFAVAQDGTESVLHRFLGGERHDGQSPITGLVLDGQGNLYGTTPFGGSGHGVVFEASADGTEKVLYDFKGFKGGDGGRPSAGLVRDAQGSLYGTTFYGGTYNLGTVFKLTVP